jgi:hypothetical protein
MKEIKRINLKQEKRNDIDNNINAGNVINNARNGTKNVIDYSNIFMQLNKNERLFERNISLAILLYSAAADKGDVQSLITLGWIFYQGLGGLFLSFFVYLKCLLILFTFYLLFLFLQYNT